MFHLMGKLQCFSTKWICTKTFPSSYLTVTGTTTEDDNELSNKHTMYQRKVDVRYAERRRPVARVGHGWAWI